MSREDRQTEPVFRRRAKEEREEGHTVKLGFLEIQVNGRLEYHMNETSKNYQSNQITPSEQVRQRNKSRPQQTNEGK